jgi:hypothetical protein
LTLGHQGAYLDLADYCRVLERIGRPKATSVPAFADDVLLAMGATQVEAMDFSAYEGAHILHDLNQPVPVEWHQRYDTVFDGGTLEHVFNFPTAIRSCMQMIKPGGRFISVTVPNNQCGHGFYQFSPELFYRIFGTSNGFSVVEMYVVEVFGRAYAVKDPAVVRARAELWNDTPLLLMVHARRDAVRELFSETPQQSDYVTCWTAGPDQQPGAAPSKPRNLLPTGCFEGLRRNVRLRRAFREHSLANRKFYTPVDLTI